MAVMEYQIGVRQDGAREHRRFFPRGLSIFHIHLLYSDIHDVPHVDYINHQAPENPATVNINALNGTCYVLNYTSPNDIERIPEFDHLGNPITIVLLQSFSNSRKLLNEGIAQRLIEKGIQAIGVDARGVGDRRTHRKLYGAGQGKSVQIAEKLHLSSVTEGLYILQAETIERGVDAATLFATLTPVGLQQE